jgi:acyl-CoA thioester hydrolase
MQRNAYSFFHPLRVRYAEIDLQGVVFNAHYLTYFDTAITEYLRDTGYSYKTLFTSRGLDFHLVKATVEFLRPIVFDLLIEIGVRVSRIGTSSITFAPAIFAQDQNDQKDQPECLAKGEIVWVCAKVGTHKSHPLPPDFVALFKQES